MHFHFANELLDLVLDKGQVKDEGNQESHEENDDCARRQSKDEKQLHNFVSFVFDFL
jgi:hypothetical protein